MEALPSGKQIAYPMRPQESALFQEAAIVDTQTGKMANLYVNV